MDLGIEGDAALVAASSSGLGKASATALAREGANVVINGRDPDRLERAVADVREVAAGEVVGQRGDVTDPGDVSALVDRTVEEFGGIDHLVTNSGGPPSKPFVETTDEDWRAAYDLLVMSVVRLVRESVEYLRDEGGGTVVTVASMRVKEPIESLVLSNAVRAGVLGLEKTLSRELAPEVRVNAVLPGTHETPRMRSVVEDGVEAGRHDSYEDGVAAWAADVPLERIGDPAEFGDAVAYLCSDRASYLNGEAVVVDGGEHRSVL